MGPAYEAAAAIRARAQHAAERSQLELADRALAARLSLAALFNLEPSDAVRFAKAEIESLQMLVSDAEGA